MQYCNIILVLTVLSGSVSALALPVNTVLATQTCEFQELKSNQSTVFGWQLAGSALDTAENDATCNTLPHTALASAGLDVQKIKAPACAASTSQINATSALPMVIQHSTQAFTTMLLHAFPASNESDFHYLCDNIRYVQLRSFMLNDYQIVNATCNKGGPDAKLSPEPFTTSAEPNTTAVAAYRNLSSKLFANNYAATATSQDQLKGFCDRAPSYSANLEALQLDPAAVSQELCSIQSVPKAPETSAKVKELSSQQFVTVAENMSNVPGWKKWLCENLDEDAMDTLGLDGPMVKKRICEDVKQFA